LPNVIEILLSVENITFFFLKMFI